MSAQTAIDFEKADDFPSIKECHERLVQTCINGGVIRRDPPRIPADDPKQPRRGSDCWRVLAMLNAARDRGCTNVEFCDAHLANFRSRLSELRRMGWLIPDGVRVREGVWRYRLEA